tara:strand:+ start:962 stop:1405 length:444 start_codon:yes stop_codon:yes gene_type:complete
MKPKSVEVYPVYICNDCGSRYCESIEYVRKVSKILCVCGKVLDLAPIETFNITPVYVTQTTHPTHQNTTNKEENKSSFVNQPETEIGESELNDSVDLLVSLGWKKREANKKVLSVASLWKKENKNNITRDNFDEFANYLFFNHSEKV